MKNEFLRHFQQEVLPGIVASNQMVLLITDSLDSKICLEVGAAVMLDKPILVLTTSRTLVPTHLIMLASEVVVVEKLDLSLATDRRKLEEALSRMAERYENPI